MSDEIKKFKVETLIRKNIESVATPASAAGAEELYAKLLQTVDMALEKDLDVYDLANVNTHLCAALRHLERLSYEAWAMSSEIKDIRKICDGK